MIKLTCSISMTSNNVFVNVFFLYKNFQLNIIKVMKKRFQKRLVKGIKVFLKLKQKKSIKKVINDTK